MAVIISCDVCDETFPQSEWEGMAMSIPNHLLGLPEEGEESYTICSWECVFDLARHQVNPGEDEEPVPYNLTPAPRYVSNPTLTDQEQVSMDEAIEAFEGPVGSITLGTTPLEKRRQPTDEVPMGDITKNRREIRLTRR